MKKIILACATVFLFFTVSVTAQSSFGLKGGLSYNSNGEFSEFINETKQVIEKKGDGKSGYHFGIYGKIDLGSMYLRPEIMYTSTTSEYVLNTITQNYKITKIDAPLLLGIELIGPLSVFAGPSLQYIYDNNFDGLDYDSIENEFTVGLNIGAAVQLGRIGLDVRYERGFTQNEVEFFDSNIQNASKNYRLDSRPEQLIFSISYSLTKKK